jgi:hypothetical protein
MRAYAKATWPQGDETAPSASNWHQALKESFSKINNDYPGYLYDPGANSVSGEGAGSPGGEMPSKPPTMRQVVLGPWALLATASRADRADALRAIFFSLAHIRDLDDVALDDWPDPIDQTVRTLGLTRLLTVNYDHELERFFRRRFGFAFPQRETGKLDGVGLPRDDGTEERTTAFNGAGVRLIQAEMQNAPKTGEFLLMSYVGMPG